MLAVALVALVLVWIVLGVVLFRVLRGRAEHIEHASIDVAEKVHRLQRLLLASWLGLFGGYLLLGATFGVLAAIGHDHKESFGAVGAVTLLVVIGTVVATPALIVRAVRPSIARVRDIPMRMPDRKRRIVAAFAVFLPYLAIVTVGRLVVPQHGSAHAVGVFTVYVVGFLMLSAVLAPLAVVHFRTEPMPPEQRARLRQLAERLGVRVRDFRILKGRTQKLANALQLGLLPGLRYVVVTDYLVDHLDPAELDAVVAHELGHAKRHHLAIKLGTVVGVVGVLELLGALIGQLAGSTIKPLLVLPVILAILLGLLLVQGLVGVRLEEAADDVAADQVGGRELAAALRELGELNHTKRDTGRAWSILTQHPGLQDRLDRLESRQSQSPAPRPTAAASP